jgi:protein-tyrosine phosphatase
MVNPRPGQSMIDDVPFDDCGYPTEPYSEVVPGLFQADTTLSPIQLFDQGFDAVFDLCGIDRGDGVADQTYIVYPIDDVPWIEEPDAIHELGNRVAELVRTDHRVVVNCMSGMNRSGLLVGRTLVALGHQPIEAVELIRRARGPHALSNREFTRFLLIDCTPRKLAALNERGPTDAGARRATP